MPVQSGRPAKKNLLNFKKRAQLNFLNLIPVFVEYFLKKMNFSIIITKFISGKVNLIQCVTRTSVCIYGNLYVIFAAKQTLADYVYSRYCDSQKESIEPGSLQFWKYSLPIITTRACTRHTENGRWCPEWHRRIDYPNRRIYRSFSQRQVYRKRW